MAMAALGDSVFCAQWLGKFVIKTLFSKRMAGNVKHDTAKRLTVKVQ